MFISKKYLFPSYGIYIVEGQEKIKEAFYMHSLGDLPLNYSGIIDKPSVALTFHTLPTSLEESQTGDSNLISFADSWVDIIFLDGTHTKFLIIDLQIEGLILLYYYDEIDDHRQNFSLGFNLYIGNLKDVYRIEVHLLPYIYEMEFPAFSNEPQAAEPSGTVPITGYIENAPVKYQIISHCPALYSGYITSGTNSNIVQFGWATSRYKNHYDNLDDAKEDYYKNLHYTEPMILTPGYIRCFAVATRLAANKIGSSLQLTKLYMDTTPPFSSDLPVIERYLTVPGQRATVIFGDTTFVGGIPLCITDYIDPNNSALTNFPLPEILLDSNYYYNAYSVQSHLPKLKSIIYTPAGTDSQILFVPPSSPINYYLPIDWDHDIVFLFEQGHIGQSVYLYQDSGWGPGEVQIDTNNQAIFHVDSYESCDSYFYKYTAGSDLMYFEPLRLYI